MSVLSPFKYNSVYSNFSERGKISICLKLFLNNNNALNDNTDNDDNTVYNKYLSSRRNIVCGEHLSQLILGLLLVSLINQSTNNQ